MAIMKTLRRCFIVGHVHDEPIIECDPRVDLNVICKQMADTRTGCRTFFSAPMDTKRTGIARAKL